MSDDWIIDALVELRRRALDQQHVGLAEQLEDAIVIAACEIRAVQLPEGPFADDDAGAEVDASPLADASQALAAMEALAAMAPRRGPDPRPTARLRAPWLRVVGESGVGAVA